MGLEWYHNQFKITIFYKLLNYLKKIYEMILWNRPFVSQEALKARQVDSQRLKKTVAE